MAPLTEDRTLRAINYRLKNTSNEQLPRILGHVTNQLVASRCIVSGTGAEATWLKTRVTSLLQDNRDASSRFCGVVLLKTILDLTGPNFALEEKERLAAWTRALLDIIKRPNLLSTKKCAIVAVTKIFTATWEHATVVRELTTPSLPTFVTTCLQQAQTTPALAEFVLEAFATLLPRHPTVFRSYATQIRGLAVSTLCTDSQAQLISTEAKDAAAQIQVLLHQTAQKGSGANEWQRGIDELITTTHATLDQVFRAVHEDWTSVAGVRSTLTSRGETDQMPDEPLMAELNGFPGWEGLQAGLERVHALLGVVQAYICTPTVAAVRIPLGRIVDLLTRALYVQAPAPRTKDAMGLGLRYNNQISREERDQLLASLPELHVSALQVMNVLLERLGTVAMPIAAHFLDLLTWLFQTESFDANLRTGVYAVTARVLEIIGPNLGKSTVKSLNVIVKTCCLDLLPTQGIAKARQGSSEVINAQLTNGAKGKNGSNATTNTPTMKNDIKEKMPGLYDAATALLPVLYTELPSELIPKATRTLLDRTCILTANVGGLVASVLNPAPGIPSLLPFLAAIAPGDPRVEGLLRPRMPVILQGKLDGAMGEGEEDGEISEDEEEGEEEEETESGADDTEDKEMYEPKVMDFAAIAAARAEEERAKQSATPIVSFGNIGSMPEPTSSKRSVSQTEPDASSASQAKKVRIFDGDDDEEVHVRRSAPKVIDEPQVLSHPEAALAKTQEKAEESDDEDGSDFEIPALVMRTDFEDEEDEEE